MAPAYEDVNAITGNLFGTKPLNSPVYETANVRVRSRDKNSKRP